MTALENGVWQLAGSSVNSAELFAAGITVAFDGSQMSGFSGVNRYAGAYKAESDGTFGAGIIASTLMAGPEPLMDAEATFLRLLQAAENFSIEGEKLELMTGDGETLTFRATKPIGVSDTKRVAGTTDGIEREARC